MGSAKTAFKFKYEIKVVQLHKVERKEGTSAQVSLLSLIANMGNQFLVILAALKSCPKKSNYELLEIKPCGFESRIRDVCS